MVQKYNAKYPKSIDVYQESKKPYDGLFIRLFIKIYFPLE